MPGRQGGRGERDVTAGRRATTSPLAPGSVAASALGVAQRGTVDSYRVALVAQPAEQRFDKKSDALVVHR
jgi:hypothetical protein